MDTLRYLWRRHSLALTGFVIAVVLALGFGVKMMMHEPPRADEPIAGWMTPRFIAHAHHIDPDHLRAVLGELPPDTRPTLQAIADYNHLPLPEVIAQIEALILLEQMLKPAK